VEIKRGASWGVDEADWLAKLRDHAAKLGCDGLVITNADRGTCITYSDGPAASPSQDMPPGPPNP
jgi:hypothetical protein